jgi:hypothetical protein
MAAAPAPSRGVGVGPFVVLGILFAGALAAVKLVHPNFANISRQLGIPVQGVAAAWKWSHARGLPFSWVLATIIVESGGNVRSAGDAGGRSVGLMQVNTVAHASELAAQGLNRESLFDVDKNVEWGTKVLREVHELVLKALGGQTPKAPVDVITRLAYKGPRTVVHAIHNGQNPIDIPWAPDAVLRWRHALTRAAAVA